MIRRGVVGTVVGLSKAFAALGCRRVRVHGAENLLAVLRDPVRIAEGRGVLTCTHGAEKDAPLTADSNHIAVLDEPLMWAALPWATYATPSTTRWSLGASDIIFKNALLRWFFQHGQTLEVLRGIGVFQRALDEALEKLHTSQWVHIFPEGAVNLTPTARLRRFKWGISRLVMEAPVTPTVVPIWLSGFDQVMPEPRANPRWLPRLGADLSVMFGHPVDPASIAPYVDAYRAPTDVDPVRLPPMLPALDADMPPRHLYPAAPTTLDERDSPSYAALRSHLAAYLRERLAALGFDARRRLGHPAGEGQLVHRPR
ncbi:Lyso-phosphatidylcholine acyltransferase [Malassezia sp. CBS 17886]|nr:Lyso-phosphatidylcholine acyltransferase [Malassezia sp. CBS 17886]